MNRSHITFVSVAPLERIEASNSRSTGLLDVLTRSFAVQIPMAGFEGFNSPLQREHFNENYLDSKIFPHATFAGRIIESIDLRVLGRYTVRAKGKLTIKGVERERIISCELVVSEEGVHVASTFDVALDEHGILIPRVVQQKVASVVQVSVEATFHMPAQR